VCLSLSPSLFLSLSLSISLPPCCSTLNWDGTCCETRPGRIGARESTVTCSRQRIGAEGRRRSKQAQRHKRGQDAPRPRHDHNGCCWGCRDGLQVQDASRTSEYRKYDLGLVLRARSQIFRSTDREPILSNSCVIQVIYKYRNRRSVPIQKFEFFTENATVGPFLRSRDEGTGAPAPRG
jgi:hypothetical protein